MYLKMSPLVVGILVISSAFADVSHVLDGSAHPLDPQEVNQLARGDNGFQSGNPQDFWWMNSNSPFKEAYDYYKKCAEKGNCANQVNNLAQTHLPPCAPGYQPQLPGQVQPPSFPQNGGGNIDINNNPFFNGQFQPGALPKVTLPPKKVPGFHSGVNIDISKNPFLNGQLTSGNGEPVSSDNGFLGVQPSIPFGKTPSPFLPVDNTNKKPFSTTHPLDNKKPFSTTHPGQGPTTTILGQQPKGFSAGEQGTPCKGSGYICVANDLCVNGAVNKYGERIIEARSEVQYCARNKETCCQIAASPSSQGPHKVDSDAPNLTTKSSTQYRPNDLSDVTAGKSSIPGPTAKQSKNSLNNGQSLDFKPHIYVLGESGSHKSSSTLKPARDVNQAASNVFQSTVDYSDVSVGNDIRFASTIQGPAYLPPVGGPTPPSSTVDLETPGRPSISTYQPSIPTQGPTVGYPSTTRPVVSTTYPTVPSQTYVPSSPVYQPTGNQQYITPKYPTPFVTQTPTYRPVSVSTTSREYLPPKEVTPSPSIPVSTQYVPSTQRPYTPPVSTYRPYQPPITPQKPFTPAVTPQKPYQPSPSTSYPTSSTGYLPPSPSGSTYNPYQPSETPQKPFTPVVTPQRPYQPSPSTFYPTASTGYLPPSPSESTYKPYQPSITPQKPYQPSPSTSFPSTPERPYTPSVTPQRPYTPPETPQRPYTPSVTPQRPYTPSVTPQRPYTPSVTPQRPYQPSTQYVPQPSSPRPTPFIPETTTPRPTYQSSTSGYSYPTPAPSRPTNGYSYPTPPAITRPTPPSYRPSTGGYEYKKPTPAFETPRPTTQKPLPQPSTNGYQYTRPTQPSLIPSPTATNNQYTPSRIPVYTPTPAPNPTQGYVYEKPSPTFGYPTPDQNKINNIYVPGPTTPKNGYLPPVEGDGSNTVPEYLKPTTQKPSPDYPGVPNTGNEVRVPPPSQPTPPPEVGPPTACAAALKCVQEIYCTADGFVSPVPVVLTKEQELSRVPTTECQDQSSGTIGKCCRDPNYKDPWPSANLVNGVDDGSYAEDDSIGQYKVGQYSGDKARPVRSDSSNPQRAASVQSSTIRKRDSDQDSCGERHLDTNPPGPGPLDANFAEIPWQAMILRDSNRSLLCGGAIIRRNAVLTNAHCVEGIETSDVLIKGGEWKLGIDEEPLPFQIVNVAAILRHPGYTPGSLINDLALLTLEEKLRPSKNIGTICLPPPNQIPTKDCIATGWGKRILQLHAKGAIMHKINVNIMDNQQCQQTLTDNFPQSTNNYSPNTLCGFSNINQCKVDYGSALACPSNGRYTLSGIYSWDTGCKSEGQIGGYIAPDVEWIESSLAKPLKEHKRIDREYARSRQTN